MVVSGDDDLLALRKLEGVRILTPTGALTRISGSR
jgi:predicted nucleic acid-binding protein